MSMSRFLVIMSGLILGSLAAFTMFAPPPVQNAPGGQVAATGKALIGGAFELTDSSGKRVTEKDFLGKPLLVYFGFTNCPDMCPAGLQIIGAALDKLGADASKLSAVFISLDPERDTPQVMGEYVKSFHPTIMGLTGSPADIANVAKVYRVYYAKTEPDPATGRYSIDHSGFMYLMGTNGQFAQHFPHTVSVEKLAEGLRKAM